MPTSRLFCEFNAKRAKRQELFNMKTKMRFVLETTESITVHRQWRMIVAYCPQCGACTRFETPEGIAVRTGMAEREIFRLVEAQVVFFLESDRVLVCSGCLTNLKKSFRYPKSDRIVILRPVGVE